MTTQDAILRVLCEQNELLKKLDPTLREIRAMVQTITFSNAIQNTVVLPRNSARQGFIANNESADDMYLSFDATRCSESIFTIKIPSLGGEYYIPNSDPYRGPVRIFVKDTTAGAYGTITELSYANATGT